jgi:SAM-dependent methyltransferase
MASRSFVGGHKVRCVTERARSFGAVAAAYAEHRPGYPPEAVDWALAHAPGLDVLDLGAGTGKLTEALVARPGVHVTAVDPDPAMLAQLRLRLAAVDAREGAAEAIPLPDASVDAVLAGQAIHWFDLDRALPEIARVLRPGGVLAGLWNGDDVTVEWVAGLQEVAAVRNRAPNVAGDRAIPLPGFTDREVEHFPHTVPTTVDGVIATLSTQSWALIADPADRDATMAAVRAFLATRPETSSGTFDLPLMTEVIRVQHA